MNHEELATKSREELVAIAEKLKIKVHHNAKEGTIIYQILQQPTALVNDSMKHKAETEVKPVISNTEEQIMNAVQVFVDKGVEVSFPGDGTWIAKFKGAIESGNNAIPLRVIKTKIESVSRGARLPRAMGKDGTYGQSYADTILSA